MKKILLVIILFVEPFILVSKESCTNSLYFLHDNSSYFLGSRILEHRVTIEEPYYDSIHNIEITLKNCQGKMDVKFFDGTDNIESKGSYAASQDTFSTYHRKIGHDPDWEVSNLFMIHVSNRFAPLKHGWWYYYENGIKVDSKKFEYGITQNRKCQYPINFKLSSDFLEGSEERLISALKLTDEFGSIFN